MKLEVVNIIFDLIILNNAIHYNVNNTFAFRLIAKNYTVQVQSIFNYRNSVQYPRQSNFLITYNSVSHSLIDRTCEHTCTLVYYECSRYVRSPVNMYAHFALPSNQTLWSTPCNDTTGYRTPVKWESGNL